MPLEVHTARLPHHGCAGYDGPDAFDCTRGSGGQLADPFAPSRELLAAGQASKRAAKKKSAPGGATVEERLELVWQWYRALYLEEMRTSYRYRRAAWLRLLVRGRVVLCCYCATANRCHRRALAEILAKLGAVDCGEMGVS